MRRSIRLSPPAKSRVMPDAVSTYGPHPTFYRGPRTVQGISRDQQAERIARNILGKPEGQLRTSM